MNCEITYIAVEIATLIKLLLRVYDSKRNARMLLRPINRVPSKLIILKTFHILRGSMRTVTFAFLVHFNRREYKRQLPGRSIQRRLKVIL